MDNQFDVSFLFEKVDQQSISRLTFSATVTAKRILTINSKSSHAYYKLASLSFRQQNYAKAEKFFKRATTIDPYFTIAHFNWGVSLARQRRFDQACIQFQKALDLDP